MCCLCLFVCVLFFFNVAQNRNLISHTHTKKTKRDAWMRGAAGKHMGVSSGAKSAPKKKGGGISLPSISLPSVKVSAPAKKRKFKGKKQTERHALEMEPPIEYKMSAKEDKVVLDDDRKPDVVASDDGDMTRELKVNF